MRCDALRRCAPWPHDDMEEQCRWSVASVGAHFSLGSFLPETGEAYGLRKYEAVSAAETYCPPGSGVSLSYTISQKSETQSVRCSLKFRNGLDKQPGFFSEGKTVSLDTSF